MPVTLVNGVLTLRAYTDVKLNGSAPSEKHVHQKTNRLCYFEMEEFSMTPNEQRMMEVIDENREKVHKLAKKV